MNKNTMFVPIVTMFLVIVVLYGIWPSVIPGHAQNNNLTTAVTVDQLVSNLTQPNPESSLEPQLKAEILIPTYYNNGTSIEQEKYNALFNDLVKEFGAVSENNSTINGYWINPQDNKAYIDKNKMYWIIVPDTEENRQYFVNLQNKLESLFDQESILIYLTPVLKLLS
jgi:hypothetical protein